MLTIDSSTPVSRSMEPSSGDGFVILSCTEPVSAEQDRTDEEEEEEEGEILISTVDIHSWDDISAILRHRAVKIQTHRHRLIQRSSYFHSLLSGRFSESNVECISVQWNLETFVNVLKYIYDCPVEFGFNNFLPFFEAALYFGVDNLLERCKCWFSEISLSNGEELIEIPVDHLIRVWNFGLEHAHDYLPELCASYLARNFMQAISNKYFVDIPCDLLLCCIKHPQLTVYSEMHLTDALLVWVSANAEQLRSSRKAEDYCSSILKQIRICLLPLWFAAGKRRSSYFTELAENSIEKIFGLMKILPQSAIDVLGNDDLEYLRIRLNEFSKKVYLSGCPQITSAVLLVSLLPPRSINLTLRESIKQFLTIFECPSIDKTGDPQALLPILSFEAVEEVDISKCTRLNPEAAVACFSESFPSLKKLKAAYLLNFKTALLPKLVQKCSLISEVDLTVDFTPLIPGQVSALSPVPSTLPVASNNSMSVGRSSLGMASYHSRASLSNVTRLMLEGRTDLYDGNLLYISGACASLQYLNLKGCISVTDDGISDLISRCIKLHSLLVCDTLFGMNSVRSLCAAIRNHDGSFATQFANEGLDTVANKLQMLHMGGCKGVDERSLTKLMSRTPVLKSLCLRGTYLTDNALYGHAGSSLETLDVSDTMISCAALAHIFRRNPSLKCLNMRDCKNLSSKERNSDGLVLSSLYSCGDLDAELAKNYTLENITLGWGFSFLSLEAMRPAIMSLKGITIGLGASLGEEALKLLPKFCPMLEAITLCFQVMSDSILINIMASLRHLEVLSLCYCFGDISMSSFNLSVPNLRKLRLERATPWMTNDDLIILTQNCTNVVEFSLLGCRLLTSDSLHTISHAWPGLISLHLEDCGEVTANGLSSLFTCVALENLLLRHNGPGIQRSFVCDAASKMPMFRQVSLDLCDACEGDFDIPNNDDRYSLSTVKIARCKFQKCSSNAGFPETRSSRVHKETLVLAWNSERLVTKVVKERL